VASEALVAATVRPRGQPLQDIAASVREALASPIDFPAVSNMVVPDDNVVVALQEGLPCASDIVAGVVSALVAAQVPPERIQILRANTDRALSPKKLFGKVEERFRSRLELVEHDPKLPECLCYLAAAKDGHPVYVNRALCEADVVLPVGANLFHDQEGCLGIHHAWFPTFADAETQERFHKGQSRLAKGKLKKLRSECDEAAWMLGVLMCVQLAPAGNDQAISVIAGAQGPVTQRARELAEEALTIHVDRRASLVVAAIGGGPDQQTWTNVARGIDAALEVVEDDGCIAICSRLRAKPGPALRRLADADSYEEAERAILRKPTADALVAARLNRALQRARVYLLSDLDEQVVESLGLAYVASAEEIGTLSSHHGSCLVLEDAQHISLAVDQDRNS
jgi:nickel-dependent lactate racemase